jgi:hypothetical protein
MEELHKIEPDLLGATSKLEIDDKELNIAAAIAALSTKMLDMAANIYQIHSSLVRLGTNIDIVSSSLNSTIRDFNGHLKEYEMRISDLEAVTIGDLGNDGDRDD